MFPFFFFSSSSDPHFVPAKCLTFLNCTSPSLPFTENHSHPKLLSPASPPSPPGSRPKTELGAGPASSTPPATRSTCPPPTHRCHRFSSFGTGLDRLHCALHPLEESSVGLNRLRIMCGGARRGRGTAAFLRPTTVKEGPTGFEEGPTGCSQLAASAKRRPTTGPLHSKTHECQQSPTGGGVPTNKEANPHSKDFQRKASMKKSCQGQKPAERRYQERATR